MLALWRAVQTATGDPDAALPYWAAAWGGGLAIGRHLAAHPEIVTGRRVIDFASGSGVAAIAAMGAGAVSATAIDIDPYAGAALALNARANGHKVAVVCRDVLDDAPPDTDVILAADCWYEARLASRVLPWLQRAQSSGIEILVGDPGRRDLPIDHLVRLAVYDVRTSTELEDLARTQARVFALRPGVPA
jgi:predicted nicotinamide N-methyase